MEEPWEEALDIDDTDITSTLSLRPCTTNLHSSKPTSYSLSQLPQPPLSPPSPPPQPLPTVRRSIPGPAGAIQAALHRMNGLESSSPVEVSTQEYIRRVDEDSGLEFTRHPWVFALDVVRLDGGGDSTPLSDVKKHENAARIDKVLALVESCKPNGLGDMMVTLKDPTDSIGASVHRKVLSTGEFGRSLAVGSVLILQKVVVFTSPCASCYLNITRDNVVKVITVHCGVQSLPERNIIARPVVGVNSERLQTTLSLTCRRNGGVIGDAQQGYHLEGTAVIQKLLGKEKSAQTNSLVSGKRTDIAANIYRKVSTYADLVNSGCSGEYHYDNTSLSNVQPRSNSAEGLAQNLEHLVNSIKGRHGRAFSSAPPSTDLENQLVGVENGGQTSNMTEKFDITVANSCGISPTTAENPIGCGGCEANGQTQSQDHNISSPMSLVESLANKKIGGCEANGQTQSQDHNISSPMSLVESLANRKIVKVNDSQKRRQQTNPLSMYERHDHQEGDEKSGVKKQRLTLISRTSVHKWTDEQLDILDMD